MSELSYQKFKISAWSENESTGGMRVGTKNGVKITHKKTLICVAVDNPNLSQHRNKELALGLISEMLGEPTPLNP